MHFLPSRATGGAARHWLQALAVGAAFAVSMASAVAAPASTNRCSLPGFTLNRTTLNAVIVWPPLIPRLSPR